MKIQDKLLKAQDKLMEEIVINKRPKEQTKLKNYRSLGLNFQQFEKIESINILQ